MLNRNGSPSIAWLLFVVGGLGCSSEGDSPPAPTASIGAGSIGAASIGSDSIGSDSIGAGSIQAGPALAPLPPAPGPQLRIKTSVGDMVVKLYADRVPVTVQNFLDYVHDGYYDGTLIHFVDPGQMVLGGGFAQDGSPKRPTRPAIQNESRLALQNRQGTIAMARDGGNPHSATTQFFINLVDAPHLDFVVDQPDASGYCVFGQVTDGLDVAEKISRSATQNRGGDLVQMPRPEVVIETIAAD